jgi:hypothetical protein
VRTSSVPAALLAVAVHYDIQVKPGTKIVTHGNGAVLGWNGFVTAVSSICNASS